AAGPRRITRPRTECTAHRLVFARPSERRFRLHESSDARPYPWYSFGIHLHPRAKPIVTKVLTKTSAHARPNHRLPKSTTQSIMHKRILIAATAALLSLPLAIHAADEGKKKGGAFAA